MGEDVRDRAWGGMDMNARFSRPLFGLALITFLMPFFSVSCAGFTVVAVSGVDLVMGKEITLFDDGGPSFAETTALEREPWAVTAAALAALGVVAGVGSVGFLLGMGGIGALLALRWVLLDKAGPELMGMSLDFEWGYWLAIVAFGLAAIMSVGVEWGRGPAKPEKPRPSPRKKGSLRPCPFCFEEVPADSAFCARCGSDLAAIPPRVWE
jgi:hypothetical protein